MTTDEIEQLGKDIEQKAVDLTLLLKKAEENNINIIMIVERHASTIEDIIRSIQITKLTQSLVHDFEPKSEGEW